MFTHIYKSIDMKNIFSFLFAVLLIGSINAQDCNSGGDAQIDLDANNVRARLLNSGDLWWNLQDGSYIAPTAEPGFAEVSAIFAGALWIGGVGPTGDLRLAAQQYRTTNATDYYPGPLKSGEASPDIEDCNNWDRFWKVNKTEVEDHINDYNDNNVIDNPISSIFEWPGRNSSTFSSYLNFDLPLNESLAPFFDRDQDGDYNPEKGDYPLIKGDQSIWWVFNDLAGLHRVTFANPMGIEVQAMAYAEASTDEHINNATYYDFKVTNKSNEVLRDAFMGLWVDFDLGCFEDDYVGYNEEYQMMYAYNQDAVDGSNGSSCQGGVNTYGDEVPIIGIKQIGNPEYPVSSFVVFNDITSPTDNPDSAFEYYNTLKGTWRDGTTMTFGGSGFDPASTDTVSYLFTGDPSDETGWSMCTAGLQQSDPKCVMSTSMNSLQPGQSFKNTYAVIFVEDQSYPCPSLDNLLEATDIVSENDITSTYRVEGNLGLSIFPNPAIDMVYIESEEAIQTIQLLNIEGQLLRTKTTDKSNTKYNLDLNGISNGMYLISVISKSGNTQVEKIIIQRG